MSIEKYATRYYSKYLFKTPKTAVLIAIYTIELLLVFLLLYKLRGLTLEFSLYHTFLILPISLIPLYLLLRRSMLSHRNFHRRFLMFTIYVTGLTLIFDYLFTIIFNLHVSFLVTYPGITFLYYMIEGKGDVENIIKGIIPLVVYYTFSIPFYYEKYALSVVIFILIGFFGFLTRKFYYWFLSIRTSLDDSAVKLANAFLNLWFAENPHYLEGLLEKYSEKKLNWVKLFKVKDKVTKKLKGLILTSSIHAGPFRNVGSSKYISLFRNTLRSYFKAPVTIVHTTTTHTNDLIFSSDSIKILNEVLKSVKEKQGEEISKARFVSRIRNGSYEILVFALEKIPFLILNNSRDGIDDIPLSLENYIENKAKTNGLKDVFVVEAHNSKPQHDREANKDIENFKVIFNNVIAKYLNSRHDDIIKIGFGEVIDKKIIECPDICSEYVYVVAFECCNKKVALAVVDGNNAAREFRREVISTLIRLGFNDAELLTTDNHEKTGTHTGEHAYIPVGKSPCKNIVLKKIESAAIKALKDLSESILEYCRVDFEAKVLSKNGFEFFEKILRNINTISYTFVMLNILAYVISGILVIAATFLI